MTVSTEDLLLQRIEDRASRMDADTAWTFTDLTNGACSGARGDEAVPVGDFDTLVWYLALARAGSRGELDLSAHCTLESRHRSDGHRGVVGCMSDGLTLRLGDYMAQTVITGDPAAFAVVAEAVAAQEVSSVEVVDRFLKEQGAGGLDGRPALSEPGRSGVPLGSTTTNEQVSLLRHLVDDARLSSTGGGSQRVAGHCLTVLGSVLKGGGLGRGLPGYGPFKTKVAHVARSDDGIDVSVRNDAAVFFDDGEPRFLVGASVSKIPLWQGEIPGIAVAEDFFASVSRTCWTLGTGNY